MQIKSVVLCFITLTIAGCGFHLRGKDILPPQLKTIQLQSNRPYGDIELALQRSLTSEGATVVRSNSAPYIIRIKNSNFTHNNQNMVSQSQATVYSFTYKTTFDLVNKKGKKIMAVQTVSTSRSVIMSPNEVLAASGEVDIVKNELKRDLVFQIMNRIGSLNTRKALAAK
ncbi:MAG: hypothetical protein KAS93_00595 [Gammaproteobacteria bacterium]|nr:hypothetical protein [Gammaproteobacteria bacterium]